MKKPGRAPKRILKKSAISFWDQICQNSLWTSTGPGSSKPPDLGPTVPSVWLATRSFADGAVTGKRPPELWVAGIGRWWKSWGLVLKKWGKESNSFVMLQRLGNVWIEPVTEAGTVFRIPKGLPLNHVIHELRMKRTMYNPLVEAFLKIDHLAIWIKT